MSSTIVPCIATTDIVPIPLLSFPPFHLQSNPSILPLPPPPFFRIFSLHSSSFSMEEVSIADPPVLRFHFRVSPITDPPKWNAIYRRLIIISRCSPVFPFLCPFPLLLRIIPRYLPSSCFFLLPPLRKVFSSAARTRLTGCCPP